MSTIPDQLFIDGNWRPAAGGAVFAVADPATEETVHFVSDASVADAREAASAAAAALPTWRAAAPRMRAELLRAAYVAMIDQQDAFADLIVTENGKPHAEALAEALYAADFFRWYSEEAVRINGSISRSPSGQRHIIEKSEPVGVALLITPWNLPAALVTRKIAPAPAAGCSVVLKPSNHTPLTALKLAQLLHDVGLPAGVVNVIPTTHDVEVVGDLIARPPVRALSFTGSTRVGSLLLAQASPRVLNCSMELGGNAPFIVLDDADVDAAVDGALVAKMRHNAEACTAANRFYVHESVKDEFVGRFGHALAALKLGPGSDPASQVGPLASAAARDTLDGAVQRALSDGANIRFSGTVPDGRGFYYPPLLLDDVDPAAAILNHELFGPVAPVVSFNDEQDMLARANATDVGLGAYVYSRDIGRALRTADALEVGMVGINTGNFSDTAAPFGGVKHSGIGREGGHHGINEFLETKYVAVQW